MGPPPGRGLAESGVPRQPEPRHQRRLMSTAVGQSGEREPRAVAVGVARGWQWCYQGGATVQGAVHGQGNRGGQEGEGEHGGSWGVPEEGLQRVEQAEQLWQLPWSLHRWQHEPALRSVDRHLQHVERKDPANLQFSADWHWH